jgi:hypothetical protein
MTTQHLVHHIAHCMDCGRESRGRNALCWAHIHARAFGHVVSVETGYRVGPDAAPRGAPDHEIDFEEAIALAIVRNEIPDTRHPTPDTRK